MASLVLSGDLNSVEVWVVLRQSEVEVNPGEFF